MEYVLIERTSMGKLGDNDASDRKGLGDREVFVLPDGLPGHLPRGPCCHPYVPLSRQPNPGKCELNSEET